MKAAEPTAKTEPPKKQLLLTGCFGNEFVSLPSGIEISDWGVDTVSFCWRPNSWKLWTHLERPLDDGSMLQGWDEETSELLGTSEVFRGAMGSALIKNRIAGGRWGYFPKHEMIYCEGHLASLYSGDDATSGLAPVWKLDNASMLAALRASEFLHPHGLLAWDPSIRRLDLACDLRFDDPRLGQVFLRGLSALDLPRLKRNVWHEQGEVQTVYFRTPKRKQVRLRIYDKARESGEGDAGSWVRVEQQFRFTGKQQPEPSVLSREDLSEMWAKPLRVWEEADDFSSADVGRLQAKVIADIEAGRITAFSGERLIGQIAMRSAGIGRAWWERQEKVHLWARRERELRDLGIALEATPNDEDGDFPLGLVLRAIRQVWRSTPVN